MSAGVQVILLGASGDLARRKLLPALASQFARGQLDESSRVIAVARRPMDKAAMAEEAAGWLSEELRHGVDKLMANMSFVQADVGDAATLVGLRDHLDALPGGQDAGRLVYLALGPSLFLPAVRNLVDSGVLKRCVDPSKPFRRVLIEKPFGTSLETAKHLNEELHGILEEEQLYRIDHYLGKETVQNLLGFRFHNAIFEPLWNRHHVELVQITVAESIGVERGRAAYYDGSGAVRDMLQNHMLQVLSLVAMEPPISLAPQAVRDQKVQVLRGLQLPVHTDEHRSLVRGRYSAGEADGEAVPGYMDEEGVSPDSDTETYVAVRAEIDTWRWSGVPFLLRHGKRMARRVTEINVQFRTPPLHLFNRPDGVEDEELRAAIRAGTLCQLRPNVLTLRIQPEEQISLSFGVKQPGTDMVMAPAKLSFDYATHFGEESSPAYERLLGDALNGDPTLFLRADEIEASWHFADEIRTSWGKHKVPITEYAPGSWGPGEAGDLFHGCEGGWTR
jgi:glucose-6-phosphate 1-dehydrogenase